MLLTTRRFTVDEFTKMAEAGIFGEDERIELIDGEVIRMAPQGDRHTAGVERLVRLLVPLLVERAGFGVQGAVRIGADWEPLPDFAVLVHPSQRSRDGVPAAVDVLLLIEVSDTSLEFDRSTKRPRYAAAGIPETWIVNLVDRVIEVSRHPTPDGYRDGLVLRPGDRISPLAFPYLDLAVSDLLPGPFEPK